MKKTKLKTPRNEWYQLGDEINGTSTGDRFGQTLSFTRDGLELVIGAHSANETSGYVKIYQYQIAKSSWNEIQHLNSSSSSSSSVNANDGYGKAIAFLENGEFLFIGAPDFSDGYGHVEAYKRLSDISPFYSFGRTMIGNSTCDHCGSSIASSFEGSYFLVGCPGTKGLSGVPVGSIVLNLLENGEIYSSEKYNGFDAVGPHNFGASVVISSNGTTLVALSPILGYIGTYEFR